MSPVQGSQIQALRKAAGLSQRELARRASLRQPTLSAIENDTARRVTVEMLEALAHVLGVEPGELLTRRTTRRR